MSQTKEDLRAEIYAEEILLKDQQEQTDKDGYTVGDPYAEAAKKIDEKNKKQNAKPSLAAKIAKSIIENHKTVGQWEKYAKSFLAMAVLAYMALSADIGGKNPGYALPKDFFSTFTNSKVICEFMKKDGIILILVTGGFLLARSYNNYLDQCDLEEYNIEKEKRKLEGTHDLSSSDDSEGEDEKTKKSWQEAPPLNPLNEID